MNIDYLFFIFSCRYSYCTSRNSFYLCTMFRIEDFLVDEIYGERLLISKQGIESENGIKSAFRKAKEQGCQTVVLDFDMHMAESILKTKKIASGLYGRHEDFTSGNINECYVVHNSKAVVVKPDLFAVSDKDTVKNQIEDEIEKLRT